MLLSEYMEGKDLWGEISTAVPTLGFIGSIGAANLNAAQVYNFGERQVLPKAAALTPPQLAGLIANQFYTAWERMELVELTANANLAGAVDATTETTTNEETKANTKDDVNKVSAYNSDTLMTNDGSNSVGSEELSGEKTRVVSRQNKSLETSFKNLDILKKNAIIQSVTRDVANFVTLPIY